MWEENDHSPFPMRLVVNRKWVGIAVCMVIIVAYVVCLGIWLSLVIKHPNDDKSPSWIYLIVFLLGLAVIVFVVFVIGPCWMDPKWKHPDYTLVCCVPAEDTAPLLVIQ